MICYFSGTGNSAFAAQRIGRLTGMEVLDLFERIRDQDYSPLQASQPWVIVTPTYAWRIPRIGQRVAGKDTFNREFQNLFCHDLRRHHRQCRSLFGKTLRTEEDGLPGLFSDRDAGKLYRDVFYTGARGSGEAACGGLPCHRAGRTKYQKRRMFS